MTTPQLRHTSKTAFSDKHASVQIHVLGALSLRGAPALTRKSHRRLLSMLLLAEHRYLAVDKVVEQFWTAAPPRTAKASIHTHISALRQSLPDGLIATVRDGYRIDTRDMAVDGDILAGHVHAAHVHAGAGRWRSVIRDADAATALWVGDPYPELAGDEFAVAEIARLREYRLEAIELRAESLLHLGRARESIADLEWATRTFPLRESLAALLALARQETGAHADAIRSLRCTERALAELGLEPSPALRELERQILNHRRALDRPIDARGDLRRQSA